MSRIMPERAYMRVLLPALFEPKIPMISPGPHSEAHVVEGEHVFVENHELAAFEHVYTSSLPR